MTNLEKLQKIHFKWANEAGYKLSINEETNELQITSKYNIISRTYLKNLWFYDIHHYIDFNKKAIIISKEEYNRHI